MDMIGIIIVGVIMGVTILLGVAYTESSVEKFNNLKK